MARDPDQLLSIREVSTELGISYETARQLMLRGILPYVTVGTGANHRLRRVRCGDLDAFKRSTQRDRFDEWNAISRPTASGSSKCASYF
jgi:hypothetical protein